MRKSILSAAAAALLACACQSENSAQTSTSAALYEEQRLPGDSALYGLACEGYNDTILVFLPYTGGDPDTINILNASIKRRVYGRPVIGDELAVILTPDSVPTASMVINLDRLKGQWCYQVMPRLRQVAGGPTGKEKTIIASLPDSLRQQWFQPREYGIDLQRDHIVRPIGLRYGSAASAPTPVEYPTMKRYRQWHLLNGHIILSETRRDSLGNQQVVASDTADIIMLRRDSLRLRFGDAEQGYYRKKADEGKD